MVVERLRDHLVVAVRTIVPSPLNSSGSSGDSTAATCAANSSPRSRITNVSSRSLNAAGMPAGASFCAESRIAPDRRRQRGPGEAEHAPGAPDPKTGSRSL
jgi:hypothetical protein